MASAEQVKALVKAHAEGDDALFFSVAMQIAAHEARLGHGKLANDLLRIVEMGKAARPAFPSSAVNGKREELSSILRASYPKARLIDMVLENVLAQKILRVIDEHRHAERILENGLSPRRKLLLTGPPGTGKTLTSWVLAGELGLPLFQVRLDGLITRYMGETAAKLRQIFDATERSMGLYFFDEFDAIGSQRGLTNDVGEMRRVLNSFLLMLEEDRSNSLIVAATNQPAILDPALFRRFDDVLEYNLPAASQIAELLEARLGRVADAGTQWADLAEEADGLSYADISHVSNEVLKSALIDGDPEICEGQIRITLRERKNISEKLGEYRA